MRARPRGSPALTVAAVQQAPPGDEMRTLTYASRDGADLLLDLYLPAQPIRRPIPVIRVSARRRMVRRHADHGSGLQALLRAGRVRDGVDRISAHSRGHVSRQRRGRADGRPVAEGQRRRARARSRSHLPVGHVGGRASGRRRRPGAARDVRGPRQSELHEHACAASWTPTARRASTRWTRRPRRSGRPCSPRWSPSTWVAGDAERLPPLRR